MMKSVKNMISKWLEKRRYKLPLWSFGYLVKNHWISPEPIVYQNVMSVSDIVLRQSNYEVNKYIRERMVHEIWAKVNDMMKYSLYPAKYGRDEYVEMRRREIIGNFGEEYKWTIYFTWRPRIQITEMEDVIFSIKNLGERRIRKQPLNINFNSDGLSPEDAPYL